RPLSQSPCAQGTWFRVQCPGLKRRWPWDLKCPHVPPCEYQTPSVRGRPHHERSSRPVYPQQQVLSQS
nr:unnamed protein product [Corynebacterium ammoniagenes] [Corynebacterium stationis]